MLFSNTFSELKKIIPNNTLYDINDLQICDWSNFAGHILECFLADFDELFDVLLSLDLQKKLEFESAKYFANKNHCIGFMDIKPKSPSNSNIILRMSLVLKREDCRLPFAHSLNLDLIFDEYNFPSASAFKEMYLNYRRIIHLLLNTVSDIKFNYESDHSCIKIKENLNLYNTLDKVFFNSDLMKLYSVSFSKSFFYVFDDIEFINTFKILLMFLDSTANYMTKRKQKDKILNYYLKLKNTEN